MLSRSNRLSTQEFNNILEKGRVFHSSLFILRILKNSKKTAFSAVAPKKVAKTAVARNRTRRRMYEAMRLHLPDLKEHTSGILFAKSTLEDHTLADIKEDIEKIFVKTGLLR